MYVGQALWHYKLQLSSNMYLDIHSNECWLMCSTKGGDYRYGVCALEEVLYLYVLWTWSSGSSASFFIYQTGRCIDDWWREAKETLEVVTQSLGKLMSMSSNINFHSQNRKKIFWLKSVYPQTEGTQTEHGHSNRHFQLNPDFFLWVVKWSASYFQIVINSVCSP